MTRWLQPELTPAADELARRLVFHPYREPIPTRTGYRARCCCGWESYRSDATKRDARDRWQQHRNERPRGKVSN